MQFEERKFLEAARKTLQTAVTDAGQKLEGQGLDSIAEERK